MSLQPKFFTTVRTYNRELFLKDLVAGVIVGIVALPLAIAFGIASGVTPQQGLYTAVIAGFIISLLGGSRVQIGGPTGAFVVIVAGIVGKFGMDGLIIATLMAGVILIAMGLAKFGGLIKFIPFPILTGFTTGIAVIIFSSQIKDFFGLTIVKEAAEKSSAMPEFLGKWWSYIREIHTTNLYTLGIALLALLIIIIWPKINRRIPGSLVAILVTTALVQLLNVPVETIGSRFGAIPSSLPVPVFPHLDFGTIKELAMPAVTIAILAAIESLMSAAVADGMIGSRHRANAELVAQGVANLASPLFGGIPATGAIARTATNVKNGARTPVAGMIHALVSLSRCEMEAAGNLFVEENVAHRCFNEWIEAE
jgi:SulP family sulfate permease